MKKQIDAANKIINKVFFRDTKKLIQEHYFYRGNTTQKLSNAPESTYSKNYLIREVVEVVGDFLGLEVPTAAGTVKGIPLSIFTPANSPLISNT